MGAINCHSPQRKYKHCRRKHSVNISTVAVHTENISTVSVHTWSVRTLTVHRGNVHSHIEWRMKFRSWDRFYRLRIGLKITGKNYCHARVDSDKWIFYWNMCVWVEWQTARIIYVFSGVSAKLWHSSGFGNSLSSWSHKPTGFWVAVACTRRGGIWGVGGGCDDSAHPSGIYNRGELPVKKLALKDNYEDIQDKELTPYINTN